MSRTCWAVSATVRGPREHAVDEVVDVTRGPLDVVAHAPVGLLARLGVEQRRAEEVVVELLVHAEHRVERVHTMGHAHEVGSLEAAPPGGEVLLVAELAEVGLLSDRVGVVGDPVLGLPDGMPVGVLVAEPA
jgi:hypothetical protein